MKKLIALVAATFAVTAFAQAPAKKEEAKKVKASWVAFFRIPTPLLL